MTYYNKLNLEVLQKPFPKEYLKQRISTNGDILDYIEAPNIIARLNEAFQGYWSFSILSHEIKDEEVIVLGSLRAGNIIKQQFGTYKRTKGKNGETSLGDDLKAGASDALKKCATLFGVALYLYTDNGNRKPVQNKQEEKEMDPFPLPNEEHPKERTSDEKPNSSRKTVPGASTKKPITIRQIAKVLNMIKDKKLSEDFVRNNIKEHYHQTLEQLSRAEASEVIKMLEDYKTA